MNIVFFTGAGVSKESGLATFRGEGGLWNGWSIHDVCTREAFESHPERVLAFYNERRRDVRVAQPNSAHFAIAQLEKSDHAVSVITQNVDDLHERAGSSAVWHLHGEIMKIRTDDDTDPSLYVWHDDLNWGDRAENGRHLRPHVVLFGEDLPVYDLYYARQAARSAEILVVAGTSLVVYPAAAIPAESGAHTIILVDPEPPVVEVRPEQRVIRIARPASVGIPEAIARIEAGEFKPQ